MIEPGHHFGDGCSAGALWHGGPFDHDDRNAALPRGVDFGAGATAAGIARHEECDVLVAHQGKVAIQAKGAAGDDDFGVWQRQVRIRFVDEAQEIAVLRLGGEWREVLAADSEEDGRRLIRQCGSGAFEIWNRDPIIVSGWRPRRSDERNQTRLGLGARRDGVLAHGVGEGVRRIDDVGDAFITDEGCEAFAAAVAAGADGERLVDGNLGAARIGIDRVKARVGNAARECVGVTCSAQYEDAGHG